MVKVNQDEDHEEASCCAVRGQHRVLIREVALGESVISGCQAALGLEIESLCCGASPRHKSDLEAIF